MKGRTLEMFIAITLLLMGIGFILLTLMMFVRIDPVMVLGFYGVAGTVSVISAIAIFLDAIKSK